MALVRYKPDGALDTSFDGDGILTADFHGSGDLGRDVAIDCDGRIVAAGYTANGSDTRIRAAACQRVVEVTRPRQRRAISSMHTVAARSSASFSPAAISIP